MTKSPPRDAGAEERSLFARWESASECPSPDLLLPAVEGILPDPPGTAIRAHLQSCSLCRELVTVQGAEDVTPTLEEAARIRGRVLPAARPVSTFRYVRYAAAAALVIAAGAAAIALWRGRTGEAPTSTAVNTPVEPVAPVFVLALTKPVTELPPESLTLRSGSPDEYAAALDRSLAPYERGDYPEAIRRLETLNGSYPTRPHPAYYLGVAKLLAGRTDAAPDLERARTLADRGSSLQAEATWYLAVALERSGQRAPATAALTDLCGSSGARKAQACDGLRALTNR